MYCFFFLLKWILRLVCFICLKIFKLTIQKHVYSDKRYLNECAIIKVLHKICIKAKSKNKNIHFMNVYRFNFRTIALMAIFSQYLRRWKICELFPVWKNMLKRYKIKFKSVDQLKRTPWCDLYLNTDSQIFFLDLWKYSEPHNLHQMY